MANHCLCVANKRRSRRLMLLKKQNKIGCLQDELLEEILCRLPNRKSAMQCKCVCKHWADLISDPQFPTRFITTKAVGRLSHTPKLKDMAVGEGKESFVLVARNGMHKPWLGLTMRLDDPVSNTRGFSISALPYIPPGENTGTPVIVVGACTDLVLYRRNVDNKYDYYIHNVQTKEWFMLPAPSFYYSHGVWEGLICDPLSTCKRGNSTVVDAVRRFSILVVQKSIEARTRYTAHMFSSDTSKWTDVVLSLPSACTMVGPWKTIGGTLQNYYSRRGLISFDPFGVADGVTVIECGFVGWPADHSRDGPPCVGVRQGQIQLLNYDDMMKYLYVWVLKDYGKGEWSLIHKIPRDEWLVRPGLFSKLRNKPAASWPGYILGQHPTNPDILYLESKGRIVLCDISKKKLQVVSRVSAKHMGLWPFFISFSLNLPIWPTPLPPFS